MLMYRCEDMQFLSCVKVKVDIFFNLCRIFNESYVPHGLKVVQVYAERGLRGLMDLERCWRQHFLTSMQPRHLPPLWSVNHNHDKYLRKYGEDLQIQLNWASLHTNRKRLCATTSGIGRFPLRVQHLGVLVLCVWVCTRDWLALATDKLWCWLPIEKKQQPKTRLWAQFDWVLRDQMEIG